MNAVSNVLISAVTGAETETGSFRVITLFCCLGLVASLFLAASGLDLGVGPY
jgi:hypothetical protein